MKPSCKRCWRPSVTPASREWVRTQLRKLEELGAIALVPAGTVMIASLRQAGLDHVERRSLIDGVARPSLEV